MLNKMNQVIRKLTDQRIDHSLDALGQMKKGIKLCDCFDSETLEFICNYFTRGKKLEWLDQACAISFRLSSFDREMILFASSTKRSKIDLQTFPTSLRSELDQPWRSTVAKRKRPVVEIDQITTSLQTPIKAVRSQEKLTPFNNQVFKHQDDTSSSKLAYLASFGFKLSNLLQTALTKSIDSAIKKRELYIENAQFNPSNRMNKITAMKHSLRDASRQRLEAVDLIQKIMLDTTYGDDPDTGEDHPLLKYVLGRNDDDHQLSPFQLQKVKVQLTTVRDLLQLIADKYEIKSKLLKEALDAIGGGDNDSRVVDSIILEYEEKISQWRQLYSIPNLILRVKRDHCNQGIDPATLLKWYNQFKKNKYQGFQMDQRGKYHRENFLEKHSIRETTLASRLEFFLRTEPDVSVAKATQWLREFIDSNFPDGHEARMFTFSSTTVHRWMQQLGAKFEENLKTYYVIKDNKEKIAEISAKIEAL